MIRPQTNAWRQATDLSGIWRIRFDPGEVGEVDGWHRGIGDDDTHLIAVPGSWNEQLSEAGFMNYVGAAWFETRIMVPPAEHDDRIELRFASVDFTRAFGSMVN